jgi:hypothetical protein
MTKIFELNSLLIIWIKNIYTIDLKYHAAFFIIPN